MARGLALSISLLFGVVLLSGVLSTATAQEAAPTDAVPASEAAETTDPNGTPVEGGDEGDAAPRSTAAADPALVRPQTSPQAMSVLLVPLTASELAALAEEWGLIVQAKLKELADLQVQLFDADGEAASSLRERITQATEERGRLVGHYNTIIDSWETKGGDEAAVTAARAYVSAITAEAARTTDARTFLVLLWSWLISWDGGLAILWKITVFLASLYVLVLVARLARGAVRKRVGRIPKTSKLLQAFLVTVTYWLVLSFGLMVVLAAIGIDVTPLFALVGGASFILAFAMQDTLSNLANGLLIMTTRPFDEGDYVIVGGTGGSVKSVNVVSTTITTPDNQVIIMPNKQVWGSSITNVTASDLRRVDLTFGISYDDDIRRALQVLREAVEAHELTLNEPEPMFAVGELADSSVNLLCRPWVKTADYWTVYWDLMADVKMRFDDAGISIPFPQQDVHVRGAAPTAPQLYSPTASAEVQKEGNPPPPPPVDAG